MQLQNFWLLFVTALIPLLTGFIYYHKAMFGNAWIKASGLTQDQLSGGKMGLIFGLTYVLGILLSFILMTITIHQLSIYGVFANDPTMNDPNSDTGKFIADFMAKHGQNFRTFKHGAFHGTLFGLFGAMPIISINALFERKSFKYVAIHCGYWILTLAIMGGVICGNIVAY